MGVANIQATETSRPAKYLKVKLKMPVKFIKKSLKGTKRKSEFRNENNCRNTFPPYTCISTAVDVVQLKHKPDVEMSIN